MKQLIYVLLIGFFLSPFDLATAGMFEDMEFGVRAQGMGGAFTAVADDPSAVRFNPAGLTQLKRPQFVAMYKELFGSTGIHNATLDVAYPTPWGTFGMGFQEVGFELAKDRALTISHSLHLTRDLAVGYNLVGYHAEIQRFGYQWAYGVDVGFLATLYRRWRLGAFIHNANHPKIESEAGNTNEYDLPQLLNVGISYTPRNGILTSLDISKEKGYSARVMMGMEFRIFEDHARRMRFDARAGVQTEPNRFSTGFGFIVSGIEIDYAITTHEKLPLTHQFGFGYVF